MKYREFSTQLKNMELFIKGIFLTLIFIKRIVKNMFKFQFYLVKYGKSFFKLKNLNMIEKKFVLNETEREVYVHHTQGVHSALLQLYMISP